MNPWKVENPFGYKISEYKKLNIHYSNTQMNRINE